MPILITIKKRLFHSDQNAHVYMVDVVIPINISHKHSATFSLSKIIPAAARKILKNFPLWYCFIPVKLKQQKQPTGHLRTKARDILSFQKPRQGISFSYHWHIVVTVLKSLSFLHIIALRNLHLLILDLHKWSLWIF